MYERRKRDTTARSPRRTARADTVYHIGQRAACKLPCNVNGYGHGTQQTTLLYRVKPETQVKPHSGQASRELWQKWRASSKVMMMVVWPLRCRNKAVVWRS